MGIRLNVKDVIGYSAYETLNGYIKKSEDSNVESTAEKIINAIDEHILTDDDLQSVKDRIKEWSLYIESQEGEYFEDVKKEISKPLVDEIKVGLIASSFASYDRYRYYQKLNENDRLSDYLGEEGDHITFSIDDYKLIKTGTSKFGNSDKWYLYKIRSGNNIINYFSNMNIDYELEHFKNASAIISKLNEYKGIKQTNVSKLSFC